MAEYEKCYLKISGMTCASCVATIEKNIGKIEGMFELVVMLFSLLPCLSISRLVHLSLLSLLVQNPTDVWMLFHLSLLSLLVQTPY